MEQVLKKVLEKVVPTEEERRRVLGIADQVKKEIEKIGGNFKKTMVVGSVARGTDLRGASDVDIFLLYEKGFPKEEMEREVLAIGKKLGNERVMYAEHPYVRITRDEVEIDVVPAYIIKKGERPESATDRSPLHQDYVLQKLKDYQKNEVRLLKAFLKGIGCYGAEIKVKGFSGYLAELLVIYYGSFIDVLKAASSWVPPVYIDIEGHGRIKGENLVVVDPVDGNRNVAAAVSPTCLAKFVLASREFLKMPSERFFFPPQPPCAKEDIKKAILQKGGKYVLVKSDYPEGESPDTVWGEMGTVLKRFSEALGKDFELFSSDAWTDEEKEILFIFHIGGERTARVKIHRGPFVYDGEHAERFLEKHRNSKFGPWVEGHRLYVEILTPPSSPEIVIYKEIEKLLSEKKYAHLLKNIEIMSGPEILKAVDDKNIEFFYRSVFRRPHWL